MTSVADNRSARRRHDAAASRRALLAAASALFDERGYEAATIRDIGDRAGVDAALIARYFGGKEGLYLATLEDNGRDAIPADPAAALGAILSRSEERGIGPLPLAMVTPRGAMREQTMAIVRERVVEPMTAELTARGVPDAELRAEALCALALGVTLTRASGTLPALAGAELDRVVAVLEPLAEALAPFDDDAAPHEAGAERSEQDARAAL
jgi:AcrR family transcriptional regulator